VPDEWNHVGPTPLRAKIAAVSFAVWTGVVAAGRLIATCEAGRDGVQRAADRLVLAVTSAWRAAS
jgi:hypothetical protein